MRFAAEGVPHRERELFGAAGEGHLPC